MNKMELILKSDFIISIATFLEDEKLKDSIEKKVHFLEKNPKYEMVRSNGVYFDETTHEKKRISDQTSDKKEDIFEDLVLLLLQFGDF